MTRPDLDAIRARLLHPNLTAEEFESIMALLSYIDGLESCTTYTVGETEWAHRIAVAEQRFVDEYDARKAAERERDELREELFDWQHAVEYILGDNWTSGDGHDAKAARKALAEWAEKAQGEAPNLLAEIEDLRRQRDAFLDLYRKQKADDAAQMREYGISYAGVRTLLAEYDGGELSIGKVLELLRAAARELAKEEIAELKARIATLEAMKP